jgi:hypothetical protein
MRHASILEKFTLTKKHELGMALFGQGLSNFEPLNGRTEPQYLSAGRTVNVYNFSIYRYKYMPSLSCL